MKTNTNDTGTTDPVPSGYLGWTRLRPDENGIATVIYNFHEEEERKLRWEIEEMLK